MNTIDSSVIAKLKEGDMIAFDEVYRLYHTRLYNFAFGILKSKEEAENILQEVFCNLWEKREMINEFKSFQGYLFSIVYNSSITRIRERVRDKQYINFVKSLQKPEYTDPASVDLELAELNEQLNEIVGRLSKRQREVFKLSREQNLSYKEIADTLGISVNTVENHMTKALGFIRDQLGSVSLSLCMYYYLFFS